MDLSHCSKTFIFSRTSYSTRKITKTTRYRPCRKIYFFTSLNLKKKTNKLNDNENVNVIFFIRTLA